MTKKSRASKGNYGRKAKEQGRGDSYGKWNGGVQTTTEVIGGRAITNLRRGL